MQSQSISFPFSLQEEFPNLQAGIFLNHAAVAPLPARAGRALAEYAEQACRLGSAGWPLWNRKLQAARRQGAALLGAGEDEIAFVHNTTHGLLCIAHALAWRPGDNIVGTAHDFPANVYPWRQLGARGVAWRPVAERPDHTFSIDDFIAAIDGRTRLVAVSLVNYASGFRLPVEQLAEVCRARGILLCVDGIQGVGALPVGVEELGCDFLAADGHKWLLGAEGLGLLYIRRERLGLLGEAMTGWVARERPWDYADLNQPLVAAARRFEEGSHNMAGAVALEAALGLLNEVGRAAIWERIEANTAALEEGLRRQGFMIESPRAAGQRSGILAASRAGLDPAVCMERLAEAGIQVAARRGWLRFSPHFYNTAAQIEMALDALRRAAP